MKHILIVLCLLSSVVRWPFIEARLAQPDDEASDDAEQIAEQVQSEPDDSTVVPAGPAMPPTISMKAEALKSFGRQHHEIAQQAGAKKQQSSKDAQVTADAKNAHIAAESAKSAAEVANNVAEHSVHITEHAQDALKDAHDALHKARVDSAGLSAGQKQSLKAAEAKLREATKKAEYGQLKNAKYVKAKVENKELQKIESKMEKIDMEKKTSKDDEVDAMQKEIEELRRQLKDKEGDKAEDDAALKELENELQEMKEAEKKEDKTDEKSHDEMKAEIERLRAQIKSMEDAQETSVTYTVPKEEKKFSHPLPETEEVEKERYDVKMKPLSSSTEKEEEVVEDQADSEVTPVEEKGIDIDTAMPYGDLEPFGREDTAQELTESSIKESDSMVDQLERAEVAEEKRAVFRALTRLRGAAITSFDGVARSQTGNIDEYNKIHKWRNSHPLHHLADEESDVSKWAFPDNAD